MRITPNKTLAELLHFKSFRLGQAFISTIIRYLTINAVKLTVEE